MVQSGPEGGGGRCPRVHAQERKEDLPECGFFLCSGIQIHGHPQGAIHAAVRDCAGGGVGGARNRGTFWGSPRPARAIPAIGGVHWIIAALVIAPLFRWIGVDLDHLPWPGSAPPPSGGEFTRIRRNPARQSAGSD